MPFFFNASLAPYLIANWAIVAFISLTLFTQHKLHPDVPSLSVQVTYRIINKRHQLLLETHDQEEALQFINGGYRICITKRWQTVIRVGRKKVVNDCTTYFVRGRKKS